MAQQRKGTRQDPPNPTPRSAGPSGAAVRRGNGPTVASDRPTVESQRVDDVDLRIIELLSADARRSVRALARELGMSPGAVSERVARLEASHVIRGYHADVDPAALGIRMHVLIGLQIEQGPPLAQTIDALLTVPEIVGVHVVSGQWDLVAVAQARDHHHLRDVVLQKVWGIPGFRHSESMLILDSHQGSASPLAI